MKRVAAFLLAAVMMVSLAACGEPASNSNAGTGYKTGTYEAAEKGMNGEVKVSVTFTDDSIASVEVVSHSETEGLSAAIEASQNGSSVILIERNAYLGGNTVRTAGATVIVDPERARHYPMTEAQMAVIEDLIQKPTDEPLVQEWQQKVAADIEQYKKEGRTDLYDSVEFTALQFYFRFGESAIPERWTENG